MTLTPPPTPMPPAWKRAIANALASYIRAHGWRQSRAARALHPTGNPRNGDGRGSPIPPPAPTTEVLWHLAFAWGVIDPRVDRSAHHVGVPMLAWHITQTNALSHDDPGAIRVLNAVIHATRATPYLVKPNRHGAPTLRRNTEYLPTDAAEALTTAVDTADVWLLDPREYDQTLIQLEADGMPTSVATAIDTALGLTTMEVVA